MTDAAQSLQELNWANEGYFDVVDIMDVDVAKLTLDEMLDLAHTAIAERKTIARGRC